eukprot:328965-Prorocentrum_lima.AAC.1
MTSSLVGSEMCIRDRCCSHGYSAASATGRSREIVHSQGQLHCSRGRMGQDGGIVYNDLGL